MKAEVSRIYQVWKVPSNCGGGAIKTRSILCLGSETGGHAGLGPHGTVKFPGSAVPSMHSCTHTHTSMESGGKAPEGQVHLHPCL